MPVLQTLITNFSSGELDPKMFARIGSRAYTNGMAKLRNVALYNTGGGYRRPGTQDLAALFNDTHLVEFEFSFDQRYLLAFSPNRLSVFLETGLLVATVIGQPWSASDLDEMTYSQRGDVVVIACRNWQTRLLRRTGATAFQVELLVYDEAGEAFKSFRPFFKFARAPVTLTPSATTGSITVTASEAVFVAGHLDGRLRIGSSEVVITTVTSPTVVTATVLGPALTARLELDPFKTTDGSGAIEVQMVKHGFATGDEIVITGASGTGGISGANISGTHIIALIDDDNFSFPSVGTATSSAIGGGATVNLAAAGVATRDWQEEAFSPVHGYPGACAFHDGRLWLGGSPAIPDGMFGSSVNLAFNFDIGDGLDTDSVQFSIGTEDVSNVRHIVSNGDLQVFTATSAMVVLVPGNQAVITPSNARAKRASPFGVGSVSPLPFDGATIFLQEAGTTMLELVAPNDSFGRYQASDNALLSAHLLRQPRDLATIVGTADRGEQYALIVNSDGTLAVFLSARTEEIAAWTLWEMTDGAAMRSVIALGNRIYVAVERATGWRLERFALDDGHLLDGAQTFTSAQPRSLWTMPLRFWNKTVDVADGDVYLGRFPVNGGGELSLGALERLSIMVGFGYPVSFKTLPVDVSLPTGPQVGELKRIARVVVKLDTTHAISVQGQRLVLRQIVDPVQSTPAAATGSVIFNGLLGWSIDAAVTIEQLEPGRLRLLGLSMRVSV